MKPSQTVEPKVFGHLCCRSHAVFIMLLRWHFLSIQGGGTTFFCTGILSRRFDAEKKKNNSLTKRMSSPSHLIYCAPCLSHSMVLRFLRPSKRKFSSVFRVPSTFAFPHPTGPPPPELNVSTSDVSGSVSGIFQIDVSSPVYPEKVICPGVWGKMKPCPAATVGAHRPYLAPGALSDALVRPNVHMKMDLSNPLFFFLFLSLYSMSGPVSSYDHPCSGPAKRLFSNIEPIVRPAPMGPLRVKISRNRVPELPNTCCVLFVKSTEGMCCVCLVDFELNRILSNVRPCKVCLSKIVPLCK